MDVVPIVTHGTWERRFSSCQRRLRNRLKPPSDPRFPLAAEIACRAERQVDALVEVVAGLAVPSDDVLGDLLRRKSRASSRNAWSSSDSWTREKSIVMPLLAFPRGDDLGDVRRAGAGVTTGQRPAPRADEVRARGGLGRNAEAALDVHCHRGGLGRLLGHEDERRRCQLRPLLGLVVEEPRRPAGQDCGRPAP